MPETLHSSRDGGYGDALRLSQRQQPRACGVSARSKTRHLGKQRNEQRPDDRIAILRMTKIVVTTRPVAVGTVRKALSFRETFRLLEGKQRHVASGRRIFEFANSRS